ncbi:hypothetical protein AB1Y20_017137 [Prymnesium parvum]|uniref:Cleavage and polyadenylation specificity factor 100 kDa subunit n=1 Tax=Prymnesium parvum TaxID=97485 RepID=A0AB34I988_PRYPA
MLSSLHDAEPGLLELTLMECDHICWIHLSETAHWLRTLVESLAERRILLLLASTPSTRDWERSSYTRLREGVLSSQNTLREMIDLDLAVTYLPRIAGRYRPSDDVVLDILPSGEFTNYSIFSAHPPTDVHKFMLSSHCFCGTMSVAGVRKGNVGNVFLLVRRYSECKVAGERIPFPLLKFLGPQRKCYAVSAFHEPACAPSILYGNEPSSLSIDGWCLAESLNQKRLSDISERETALPTAIQQVSNPMIRIAERTPMPAEHS